MRLLVVSHKTCWPSTASPTGYATDGGFAFQMGALAELFDATTLLLPCDAGAPRAGEVPLLGHELRVQALEAPRGRGLRRKAGMIAWAMRNVRHIAAAVRRADAVHAPIPGDVGTIGILLALVFRKPLFVRHCGNWSVQRTAAEHVWRWLLERIASERTMVLATGGGSAAPSAANRHVRWIFSTTLSRVELARYGTPRVLDGSRLRLLIACRQDERKGVGVVIAALARLVAEYPAVSLDVVGDGPDLAAFRAQAQTLGVAARVTFHGKVGHEEVLRCMGNADLFCYPTRASEGFPKVVLEAMACGLPVITTPVSVLGELMQGGGGTLIDRAEPDAVAQAVGWCVAHPRRYAAMSEAAVRTAGEFTLEGWRDRIGALLGAAWGRLRTHG